MSKYTNYIPESCADLLEMPETDLRSEIPKLAKDSALMSDLEAAVESVPTDHQLEQGDARDLDVDDESVELVVTSPPYFDLKEYDGEADGQLGDVSEYDEFSELLGQVWANCYEALVPGGRMCVVAGDVLRSRSEYGRHRLVPLHARIQEQCMAMGFDPVAPIIWHKFGNTTTEAGDGARFLGKPYEPGAAVENDVEYILLFRKPGSYRSPSRAQRLLSVLDDERHKQYFTQVWSGVSGALQEDHPAPYPVEIAERLVRMFSFVGDTVMDPFAGTGTTAVAASRTGRNSLSRELVEEYVEIARTRLENERRPLVNWGKMEVSA